MTVTGGRSAGKGTDRDRLCLLLLGLLCWETDKTVGMGVSSKMGRLVAAVRRSSVGSLVGC